MMWGIVRIAALGFSFVAAGMSLLAGHQTTTVQRDGHLDNCMCRGGRSTVASSSHWVQKLPVIGGRRQRAVDFCRLECEKEEAARVWTLPSLGVKVTSHPSGGGESAESTLQISFTTPVMFRWAQILGLLCAVKYLAMLRMENNTLSRENALLSLQVNDVTMEEVFLKQEQEKNDSSGNVSAAQTPEVEIQPRVEGLGDNAQDDRRPETREVETQPTVEGPGDKAEDDRRPEAREVEIQPRLEGPGEKAEDDRRSGEAATLQPVPKQERSKRAPLGFNGGAFEDFRLWS